VLARTLPAGCQSVHSWLSLLSLSVSFLVTVQQCLLPVSPSCNQVVELLLPRLPPELCNSHMTLLTITLHACVSLEIDLRTGDRRIPDNMTGLRQRYPMRHRRRHSDKHFDYLLVLLLESIEDFLTRRCRHTTMNNAHADTFASQVFGDHVYRRTERCEDDRLPLLAVDNLQHLVKSLRRLHLDDSTLFIQYRTAGNLYHLV